MDEKENHAVRNHSVDCSSVEKAKRCNAIYSLSDEIQSENGSFCIMAAVSNATNAVHLFIVCKNEEKQDHLQGGDVVFSSFANHPADVVLDLHLDKILVSIATICWNRNSSVLTLADTKGFLHFYTVSVNCSPNSSIELNACFFHSYPVFPIFNKKTFDDRINIVVYAPNGDVEDLEDLYIITAKGFFLRIAALNLSILSSSSEKIFKSLELEKKSKMKNLLANIIFHTTQFTSAFPTLSRLLFQAIPDSNSSTVFVTTNCINESSIVGSYCIPNGKKSKISKILDIGKEGAFQVNGIKSIQLCWHNQVVMILSSDGVLSWWDTNESYLLYEYSKHTFEDVICINSHSCDSGFSKNNLVGLIKGDTKVNLFLFQIDFEVVIEQSKFDTRIDPDSIRVFPSNLFVDLSNSKGNTCHFMRNDSTIYDNVYVVTATNTGYILRKFEDLQSNFCSQSSDGEKETIEIFKETLLSLTKEQNSFSVDIQIRLKEIISNLFNEEALFDEIEVMECFLSVCWNEEEEGSYLDFIRDSLVSIRHQAATKCYKMAQQACLKWITFRLVSSTTDEMGGELSWRQFRQSSVTSLVANAFSDGALRAGILIWKRHAAQEINELQYLSELSLVLDSIPTEFPVEAYRNWLKEEVELFATFSEEEKGGAWEKMAEWLYKRALSTQESELDQARLLTEILPRQESLTNQIYSSLENDEKEKISYCQRLSRLYLQIEELSYLAKEHNFYLSLSSFVEESICGIGMAMLDRVELSSDLLVEIETHLVPFLSRCSSKFKCNDVSTISLSALLAEYIVELCSESSDGFVQRGLILLQHEAFWSSENADVHQKALLEFCHHLRPPYPKDLLEWLSNYDQIDQNEELREQYRLMRLQDLMSRYDLLSDTYQLSFNNQYEIQLLAEFLTCQLPANEDDAYQIQQDCLELSHGFRSALNLDRMMVRWCCNYFLAGVSIPQCLLNGATQAMIEEIVYFAQDILTDDTENKRDKRFLVLSKLVNVASKNGMLPQWQVFKIDRLMALESEVKWIRQQTFFSSPSVNLYLQELSQQLWTDRWVNSNGYKFWKLCISYARACVHGEGTSHDNQQYTIMRAKEEHLLRMSEAVWQLNSLQQNLLLAIMNNERGLFKETRILCKKVLHTHLKRNQYVQYVNHVVRNIVSHMNKYYSNTKRTNQISLKELCRFMMHMLSYCLQGNSWSIDNVEQSMELYKQTELLSFFSDQMLAIQPFQSSKMKKKKQSSPSLSLKISNSGLLCYNRWYRGDVVVFPLNEILTLIVGMLTQTVAVNNIPAKKLVSLLVRNNATIATIQVLMYLSNSMMITSGSSTVEMGKVLSKQYEILLDKIFQSAHLDCKLAFGVLLSLDQRVGFDLFKKQLTRENTVADYYRLRSLAVLGCNCARRWQEINFLYSCTQLHQNSKWWHQFQLLEIDWQPHLFRSPIDTTKLASLLPQLIVKTCFDFQTVSSFAIQYNIPQSLLGLIWTEQVLLDWNNCEESSKNLSTTNRFQLLIQTTLEEVHDHQLLQLGVKLLAKLNGLKYDLLHYILGVLANASQRSKSPLQRDIRNRLEVVEILMEYKKKNTAINFHDLVKDPWQVLNTPAILNSKHVNQLVFLSAPLGLDPDEFYLRLIRNHACSNKTHANTYLLRATNEGKLQNWFDQLEKIDCKLTILEWLASNNPTQLNLQQKIEILEYGLNKIRQSTTSESPLVQKGLDRLNWKQKKLHVERLLCQHQQYFAVADIISLLSSLSNTKETMMVIFRLIYEDFCGGTELNESLVHDLTNQIAHLYEFNADKQRKVLVQEWLSSEIQLTHHYIPQKRTRDQMSEIDSANPNNKQPQSSFFEMELHEKQKLQDEKYINQIVRLCHFYQQTKMMSFLVIFLLKYINQSKSTKSAVAYSYRVKYRAVSVLLRLVREPQLKQIIQESSDSTSNTWSELLLFRQNVIYLHAFEEIRSSQTSLQHFHQCQKHVLALGLYQQFFQQATNGSISPTHKRAVLRLLVKLLLDFESQWQQQQLLQFWSKVLLDCLDQHMNRFLLQTLLLLISCNRLHLLVQIDEIIEVYQKILVSPIVELIERKISNPVIVKDDEKPMNKRRNVNEPSCYSLALNSISEQPIVSFDTQSLPPDTKDSSFSEVAKINIPEEQIGEQDNEMEVTILLDLITLVEKCPFLNQIDLPGIIVQTHNLLSKLKKSSQNCGALISVLHRFAVICALHIPSSNIRFAVLGRLIEEGLYLPILQQIQSLFAFNSSSTSSKSCKNMNESDIVLAQLVFEGVEKAKKHDIMIRTPFEIAFMEYLAAVGSIDTLLLLFLKMECLEEADNLAEMYFENYPESYPAKAQHQANQESFIFVNLKNYQAISKNPDVRKFKLA